MLVPTRNFASNLYRYGFQNQEKDDEIKGSGNSINYKYRMHDTRAGRFLSLDPLTKKYPWNSPYAFSENRVIDGVELEGLEFYHFSVRFLADNQGTITHTAVHADYVQEYIDWKMPSWDATKEYDITGKYPAPKSYILNVNGSNFIFPTYKELVTSVADGSWKNLTPENHPTLQGIEDEVKKLYNKTDALGGVLSFGVALKGFFRNIGKKKLPIPVKKGASNISAIDDAVEEVASSKVLGKNLQSKGVMRPDNSAAHHIVAGNDKRAAIARSILKKEGISINDADNGVFLPKNTNVASPPASTHSTLHTNKYYENLTNRLLNSKNVRQELKSISKELKNGTFEH